MLNTPRPHKATVKTKLMPIIHDSIVCSEPVNQM